VVEELGSLGLSSLSRAFLDKLLVALLLRKFSCFYGTIKSITVYTKSRCLLLRKRQKQKVEANCIAESSQITV
jgi:hypothetical protein